MVFQAAATKRNGRPEPSTIWVLETDRNPKSVRHLGFDPVFLPGGQAIAFLDSPDGRATDVAKVNLDGTRFEVISRGGSRKGELCVSPDQQRLVYWSTMSFRLDGDIVSLDLKTHRVETLAQTVVQSVSARPSMGR